METDFGYEKKIAHDYRSLNPEISFDIIKNREYSLNCV
jgi:hypothetical protein